MHVVTLITRKISIHLDYTALTQIDKLKIKNNYKTVYKRHTNEANVFKG